MIKIIKEQKDEKEAPKKDSEKKPNPFVKKDDKEKENTVDKKKKFPQKGEKLDPFAKEKIANDYGEFSDEQQKNMEMKDYDLSEPDKMQDDIKNIFKKVKMYIDNPENLPEKMKPEGYAFSLIYKKGKALDYSGGWLIWKNDNVEEEEYIYTMSDGYFWKYKGSANTVKDSENKDDTGDDKEKNPNPFDKEKKPDEEKKPNPFAKKDNPVKDKSVEKQVEYAVVFNKVKTLLPESCSFEIQPIDETQWLLLTENNVSYKDFLSFEFKVVESIQTNKSLHYILTKL